MKYYGLIIPSVFPTGVFIQDIKQTASSDESEGVNTMTITLTNQQKAYFHVKNGHQGSVAEATAQMEKLAKDYIASELKEQKEALEKAIENGEAVINNAINEAMAKTNTNIIKLLQNGYVQWPGMPRPDTLFNFPGYRWAEVDYNGCFFRTKGANANTFGGGEQGDAIRNIKGGIDTALSAHCYQYTWNVDDGSGFLPIESEALVVKVSHDQMYRVDSYNIRAVPRANRFGSNISINASRVVPTAEENRPRNKTIIIWRLEKI